jgi:molecular chaperone DnaK
MPSAVRREDSGDLVVGVGADRAGWAPETVDRVPKRSLGEVAPIVLGGAAVDVADAVAAVLRTVLDEGTRTQNGLPPDAALLTHPARWTEPQLAALVDAAGRAGLPRPQLVPEPVAAAAHHRDLAPGELLALYDLGGTFAAAVLRRTSSGFELLAEGGSPDRGSEHLDDLLVTHIGKQLKRDVWAQLVAGETETWRRRATELRRDARTAKESLSRHKRHIVHVSAAASDVPITRDELEEVFGASVAATATELMATVARAGATPDEVTRYGLVGGGSHMPLVARLVGDAAGATPSVGSAPEKAVVLGAARIALSALAAATTTVIPVVTAEPRRSPIPDPRPAARDLPRKRTWRRPTVMFPLGAAAAAIAVAAVTTIALHQRALGPVVDAASAAPARSTPSFTAPTTRPEPSADADAPPSITPVINGPSQVAVGDNEHYTATYSHPELVATCRWTDTTGKVVPGCGWLPVSFANAASYTLRFTIVQTTGETRTVTKTITAA